MQNAPVYTGTMGWSYEDWRGPFYERGLAAAKMLEQYARVLPTIELDSTFYGFPRRETLAGWQAQTPPDFRFSAKVPRAVTHERRLIGAAEMGRDFARLLTEGLDDQLCALLLQLPPDLSAEERPALEEFIEGVTAPRAGLPANTPWVVEFRNATWQETDIAAWLAERGVGTATTERLDLGGPLRYVRLLGTENSVARFDAVQIDRAADLDAWAARIDTARQEAPDPIFVYVRNFFEGHAPATIAKLRDRLGLPNATPPGQQQMSLF